MRTYCLLFCVLLCSCVKKNVEPAQETITYTLTLNTTQGGTLNSEGGTYEKGTTISLTAVPQDGFQFAGWSGAIESQENPISIQMDADQSLTAHFVPSKFALHISISGNGTVTQAIESAQKNPTDYEANTLVRLTAQADEEWLFYSWSGASSSTYPIEIVQMSETKGVTATFEKIQTDLIDATTDTFIGVGKWKIRRPRSNSFFKHTAKASCSISELTLRSDFSYTLYYPNQIRHGHYQLTKNDAGEDIVLLSNFEEENYGAISQLKICPNAFSFALSSIDCSAEEEAVRMNDYREEMDPYSEENRCSISAQITQGNATQTVSIGVEITPMHYAITTNCTQSIRLSYEGLPSGITAVLQDNELVISGRLAPQDLGNYAFAVLLDNGVAQSQETPGEDPTASLAIRGEINVLAAKKIYFEDGHCKCPYAAIGDTEVIDNVTYMAVDNTTIHAQIIEKNINLCTTHVTNMGDLFRENTSFNEDISFWDTSNVNNMAGLFQGATSFNQNIGTWDVSSVTKMIGAFKGASAFNQNIGGWDTQKVIDMQELFEEASSFNQDIGDWNTSKVDLMDSMFKNATAFSQDLSQWCVSNIGSEPQAFALNAALSEEQKPKWGTCPN